MRRWFWLATGFGLGVAAARRASRRRGAAPDAAPDVRSSGAITRRVRAHLSGAVDEGRREARRRERALRRILATTRNGQRDDGQ